MRNVKGFSLIELLIVVAIIIIISAIAVPSLLQARRSANESAAVANLRSIASAEFTYASRNNQQFGSLLNLVSTGYLDGRFVAGQRVNGHNFSDTNVAVTGAVAGTDGTAYPNGFGVTATAVAPLADINFGVAADGVVRYQGGGTLPAGISAGDPVGKQ